MFSRFGPQRYASFGAHVTHRPGLATLSERRARVSGEAVALVYRGATLTYRDVHERVLRRAAELRRLGVGRGDRVAYLGPNHPALVETMLATVRLGAVFLPLNHRLTAPELTYQLDDSKAAVLVADSNLAALAALRAVTRVHEIEWSADYVSRPADVPAADVGGDDPAFLLYTSGTTGHPKGAVLTHENLLWNKFGAAGSPLPVEGYQWVADRFGPGVLLNVGSGGTDVCTGIVQASPMTPVYAGEMSGPSLGFAATAYDEDGTEVIDLLGELVITEPVPSMPVKFWGDQDGSRYLASYFERYPDAWCHGDWIRFRGDGGVVITGRSDATLNRGGVRLGTAEFYRVVEELDGITDSLVVHIEDDEGGMGRLLLLVVTDDGVELTTDLRKTITSTLRQSLSPRHMPDDIRAVPVVPYNRTGKKLEIPVKRILLGADPATVVAPGSLAREDSLDAFGGVE
ncbi:hypothetical protein CH254_24120 [Rhodococcus sp. 06-412-2C]|uniref:AMP-binding protein n=1 Tax=unclassified Rhodococcus (in: high G+C Gram-positive bacteria) TaxID=192944 RepID=UPI000B9B2B96|nr:MULTISPECIES: AMP-binding protein [unclassified Rhodococcus (in: high G+C Gram-positive bacteria)]OZC83973.1 hypothetical protein CH254_24120 [Rhodococcus sp. 06-412-2C]OZC94160.1 hypothetical protein CH279_22205 [Rhodococcus sp. 06-412-2B]